MFGSCFAVSLIMSNATKKQISDCLISRISFTSSFTFSIITDFHSLFLLFRVLVLGVFGRTSPGVPKEVTFRTFCSPLLNRFFPYFSTSTDTHIFIMGAGYVHREKASNVCRVHKVSTSGR